MKKIWVLALFVLAAAAVTGCAKKQETEELQPITMESLSTTTATQAAPEAKVAAPAPAAAAKELEALPPSGPFKPSNQDIQAALKNAGFYAGVLCYITRAFTGVSRAFIWVSRAFIWVSRAFM